MLDFDILSIVVFAIVYFIIIIFLRKKNNNNGFLFVASLLYIYLVIVIKYTQFPIFISNIYKDENNYKIIYNLVPLFNLTREQFVTSVFNIILFLPFGFLYFIISRFSYKKTLIKGFFLSFLIETLQILISFITCVSYRIFDVNDLIFNTLGVFIGIVCFIIFNNFINKIIYK